MAKIVIDGREILGTTGRYIRKLLEYLQQIDTENEYIVLLHPDGYENTQLTADNFSKFQVTSKKFTVAEQLRLAKNITRLKPDLVHFTMPNQPAFLTLKRVTTIHDLTPMRLRNLSGNSIGYKLKSYIFSWLVRRVARQSEALITASQYVKDDITQFTRVNDSKIAITQEAADIIEESSKQIADLADKKFIFYTGRAQPHKNLAALIKAFEKIHTQHKDVFLVLAGKHDRSYEKIVGLASRSKAKDNIIFTGFVSDAELKWLYENARAYVFPSLSEGFGLPGLEAMVHGCPVVSSNATCLPEVYGDAAVYFDPTDPQDIADNILEVISDSKLRDELIDKGHEQAAKFSWRRMAEQTLEVYKQVLGENSK